MNLAKFSRRRYTYYDTPIEYLANLTKVMGGPNIYMKRDDLLGLTGVEIRPEVRISDG